MARKLWLGVGALALGAAMLVGAQLANASRGFRQGGIFKAGFVGASPQIDPQLSWITTGWWLEYATAAKLYNYPDRPGQAGALLRPEVASGYTVSRDGRTYTFTIRRGFRFSDGSPVTARNFAYAIDRAANHALASPAAPFITDPNGTNIVGAKAVNDGKATHVRGVVATGNRLVIHLTRRDPTLLTKLAMPFFQATSTALPLTQEKLSGYPSAGPYFIADHESNVQTTLRRNPYYRGARPHHLGGVNVRWSLDEEAGYQQVRSNELDEGPLPEAHVNEVAKQFGLNKARFWAKPLSCSGYVLFNNARGIFKGNVPLRQAVNWALDRTDYAATAGPYAAFPLRHLLPPAFPGSIDAPKLQPYGVHSNLVKARKLAAGHFRSGRVVIAYSAYGSSHQLQANIVRRDLIRLGFDPAKVSIAPVSQEGSPPVNWDAMAGSGWCSDYADPFNFFSAFFLQPLFGPKQFVLGDRTYEKRILAANRLVGPARFKAFGRLDLDVIRNLAPLAPMRTYNNRYFFSDRVDPHSLVFSGVYEDWSIPALALK